MQSDPQSAPSLAYQLYLRGKGKVAKRKKTGGRAVDEGDGGSSDDGDGSLDQDGIDDGVGEQDQDGSDGKIKMAAVDEGEGGQDGDADQYGDGEQSDKLLPMDNDRRLLQYLRDLEVENENEFIWADVERDLLFPARK